MRKRFISIGVLSLILASCGARHALPMPGGGNMVKPQVVQTGKLPVNWTQFNWGDTLNGPANGGGAVSGPDKNVWYTDTTGAALIKMTMSGSTHAYPLKYNVTQPYNGAAIAVGADNKFYITGQIPYIGVATTSGSFSAIPIPSGDSSADAVTLGPDGNVWFVENGHVAKITPGGTITEYPYPNDTNNYGGAITTGPDGDIWVTEQNAQLIDDVDPSTGEITQYAAGCYPYGIVSGPDGNLYVNCSGSLERVTTSGTITAINLGFSANSQPPDFVIGPDGNPWFTIGSGNQIADYNVATNTLKIYFPPTSYSTSYGLTAGPDNNIWAMDSVGKIDVYILNIISVSPKTLTFTGGGHSSTLTVTEKGTSAWTASSSNPGVATVAQGSPANKFTVTSVASGRATITVTDAVANSFAVKVTVH